MKHVLDVGNCDPDHAGITAFLMKHFDVRVDRAKLPTDTLAKLRADDYDLVLINRKLDADYSDGIEILKAIKADAAIKATPVMLVTNYDEHQDAAVAAGALRGFGKLEFNDPAAAERVRSALGA